MSNRCAQLGGAVVVGESLLSIRFEHPALVWVEETAPELIGHHYDPETRTFYEPTAEGERSEVASYTAPEGAA